MTKKENDFDLVAGWYDSLVKLVFGNAMVQAQTRHLGDLPHAGNALILGGGTGWIAESLLKIRPNLHVTYVDASAKMIQIAKQRLVNHSQQISFVHGTEAGIPTAIGYDVVITNFFLDLFDPEDLPMLLGKIKFVAPDGFWIVTDFVKEKWWQKIMLIMMYAFFRYTSNIRAKRLPPWREALIGSGVQRLKSASFFGGFIQANLYRINE